MVCPNTFRRTSRRCHVIRRVRIAIALKIVPWWVGDSIESIFNCHCIRSASSIRADDAADVAGGRVR